MYAASSIQESAPALTHDDCEYADIVRDLGVVILCIYGAFLKLAAKNSNFTLINFHKMQMKKNVFSSNYH